MDYLYLERAITKISRPWYSVELVSSYGVLGSLDEISDRGHFLLLFFTYYIITSTASFFQSSTNPRIEVKTRLMAGGNVVAEGTLLVPPLLGPGHVRAAVPTQLHSYVRA